MSVFHCVCIPHPFQMDESLSDKCVYNKYSWKQRSLCHARANTIYELADPYNATINVNAKLCHQFWEEKGRGVVLQQPVCLVFRTFRTYIRNRFFFAKCQHSL